MVRVGGIFGIHWLGMAVSKIGVATLAVAGRDRVWPGDTR